MSQTKIEKLTPEQEALIPVIREKWKAIALSTERIDHQKATVAVKAAYRALNLNEPEILFFDSPFAAVSFLESQPKRVLGSALMSETLNQLIDQVNCQIDWETDSELPDQIENLPSLKRCQLGRELKSNLKCQQKGNPVYDCIHAGVCLCIASQLDFCISVLNVAHEQSAWSAYKSLMNEGSYIFTFEKMCLICDRPIKHSIDSEERLHAEAEPAIEFSDGFFRKYVYQGVEIPEEYGRLHPSSVSPSTRSRARARSWRRTRVQSQPRLRTRLRARSRVRSKLRTRLKVRSRSRSRAKSTARSRARSSAK